MSEYICLEMFQYLKKKKMQEETGKKGNIMKKTWETGRNKKTQEETGGGSNKNLDTLCLLRA